MTRETKFWRGLVFVMLGAWLGAAVAWTQTATVEPERPPYVVFGDPDNPKGVLRWDGSQLEFTGDVHGSAAEFINFLITQQIWTICPAGSDTPLVGTDCATIVCP